MLWDHHQYKTRNENFTVLCCFISWFILMVISGHLLYCFMLFYFLFYIDGLLYLLRPWYSSSGVIPPILETPELELEPRCVVIFCGKQEDGLGADDTQLHPIYYKPDREVQKHPNHYEDQQDTNPDSTTYTNNKTPINESIGEQKRNFKLPAS
jgi:hypothetical protein